MVQRMFVVPDVDRESALRRWKWRHPEEGLSAGSLATLIDAVAELIRHGHALNFLFHVPHARVKSTCCSIYMHIHSIFFLRRGKEGISSRSAAPSDKFRNYLSWTLSSRFRAQSGSVRSARRRQWSCSQPFWRWIQKRALRRKRYTEEFSSGRQT